MDLRKATVWLIALVGLIPWAWVGAGQQVRRVDDAVLKNAGKTGEDWLKVSNGNAGPGNAATPFSPKLLTFVLDGSAPMPWASQPKSPSR